MVFSVVCVDRKLVSLLLLLLLLLAARPIVVRGYVEQPEEAITKKLLDIRANLERQFPLNESRAKPEWYLGHWNPAHQYCRGDSWTKYIEDLPIIVHNFWGRFQEFGNYIGLYLEAIACAKLTNMHYLAMNIDWEDHSGTQLNESRPLKEFISLLPDVIPYTGNNAPRNKDEANRAIRSQCPCNIFCWQNSNAAWVKKVEYLREVFMPALSTYIDRYERDIPTTVDAVYDMVHYPDGLSESDRVLPLIPDASIQLRCSDVLHHDRYGFVPFKAYKSLIPSTARHIILSSDHPQRRTQGEECKQILQSAFDYLKHHFPSSIIVIKRGDDLFRSLARISFSPVSICSPSTFCLWPALLSSNGTAYYPLSNVALQSQAVHFPESVSKHFKWMTDFRVLHFIRNEDMRSILNALNQQ